MQQARTEILYRDTTIAIEYNPEGEWIYANWRGYQNYDTVVAGCEKIQELMKEIACFRILNDNTRVEGQWSTASRWVAEEWFSSLRANGLQLFAWVYSPSMLSRLSASKAVKLAKSPEYIKVFDEITLAEDWLRSNA